MDKIILIPFIISATVRVSREPKDVFILVFLPALTLMLIKLNVRLANKDIIHITESMDATGFAIGEV